MLSGQDKRKFPRVSVKGTIQLAQSDGAEPITCDIINLGLGGLCMAVNSSFDIFAPVKVSVELEDSLPALEAYGTVVWVIRRAGGEGAIFDTGIEFAELPDPARERIEAVVQSSLGGAESAES